MSNRSTPRSTPRSSPPTSLSPQPKRLNISHAARQRAYLDERRRQKVIYHLGDSSNKSLHDDDPSETNSSHHDPLHVTAVGLDPTDKKATATSMSRKFFLTPPERLQVDQSVNLMDVEAGFYDFETTRDSQVIPNSSNHSKAVKRLGSGNGTSGGGGIFSSLMASYSHPTLTTTAASNTTTTTTATTTATPSTSNTTSTSTSTGTSFLRFFSNSFSPASTSNTSTTTPTPPSSTSTTATTADPRQSFASEGRRDSLISVQLHNQSEASKYSAMHGHSEASKYASAWRPPGFHDNHASQDLNATTHSQRKASHRSLVEAFLDEELGEGSEDSKQSRGSQSSSSKARRRKKKEKTKSRASGNLHVSLGKVEFPEGYDPNEWEHRAAEAKKEPLLLSTTVSVDSSMDTVAHDNKSKPNQKKTRRGGRRPRPRRLGKRQPTASTTTRRRRLRLDRLALVLGALFFVIMIILIVLIATGQILWNKWHSDDTSKEAPVAAAPLPIERNHSYLDVDALPASTQFLLQQDDQQSAQSKALKWLQQDSKTTVSTDTVAINGTTTENFPSELSPLDTLAAMQKFVMTTLYYSTDGPNSWTGPVPWMDLDLNECDWFGLDAKYFGEYSVCNRYHQLHAILLNHQGLVGRLPTEEMTLLSNLKHLDVGNNTLMGIVPGVWFQSWRNLEYLNVQDNAFTGQLPSELGLLTNSNGLRELVFGGNQFTGTIPSELGELMNHLDVLDVSDNRLTGTIPSQLGVGSTDYRAMERLSLHSNELTGQIPSELGLLTMMTSLELHHNPKLQRQDMPQEICDLSRLTRLTVDCDVITCPENCDCTCVDQQAAASATAVPDEEVFSGGMVAEDRASLIAQAAAQRPKITKVSDLKPSEEKDEPSSDQPKKPKIHKISDLVPSGTEEGEEEGEEESETRTIPNHPNIHIHVPAAHTEEQEEGEEEPETRTVPNHPNIHIHVPAANTESEEEEAENEPATRSIPNHPNIIIHRGSDTVPSDAEPPETRTTSNSEEPKMVKKLNIFHKEQTRSGSVNSNNNIFHKITNDMAPSPAQGEIGDFPSGEFMHSEVNIRKRPLASKTLPKQEEFEAGATIKHRPTNNNNRRFLRPSRDSL